jgi:hypothetical protein
VTVLIYVDSHNPCTGCSVWVFRIIIVIIGLRRVIWSSGKASPSVYKICLVVAPKVHAPHAEHKRNGVHHVAFSGSIRSNDTSEVLEGPDNMVSSDEKEMKQMVCKVQTRKWIR